MTNGGDSFFQGFFSPTGVAVRRGKSLAQKGMTLIEILLVLAIAAFITVSAVRYYQAVTRQQQALVVVNKIQRIIETVNKLTANGASYSDVLGGSSWDGSARLSRLLGEEALKSPWPGCPIEVTAFINSNFYYILMNHCVPVSICGLIINYLKNNSHLYEAGGSPIQLGSSGACGSTNSIGAQIYLRYTK